MGGEVQSCAGIRNGTPKAAPVIRGDSLPYLMITNINNKNDLEPTKPPTVLYRFFHENLSFFFYHSLIFEIANSWFRVY
jgi:hypothetical protein